LKIGLENIEHRPKHIESVMNAQCSICTRWGHSESDCTDSRALSIPTPISFNSSTVVNNSNAKSDDDLYSLSDPVNIGFKNYLNENEDQIDSEYLSSLTIEEKKLLLKSLDKNSESYNSNSYKNNNSNKNYNNLEIDNIEYKKEKRKSKDVDNKKHTKIK
jgi:hypothetical protein